MTSHIAAFPDVTLRRRVQSYGTMAAIVVAALVLFGAAYASSAAWGRMWLLAFAIFYALKGLTYVDARRRFGSTTTARTLAFFFAWPGMDADVFFLPRGPRLPVPMHHWVLAVLKTLQGCAMLWIGVPLVVARSPVAAAWLGMTGIVVVLHFGVFDLLAYAWRSAGFAVDRLMDRPLLATSLADFWGRRWNRAFRRAADRLVYRPTARRYGATTALVASFAFSGLVHDAVISLPAGAGLGWPTAYFLIQAGGALLAHSPLGRRLRLNGGVTGRTFTALVVLAPVGWLFHTPFQLNVVLPFLRVLGCY